MVSPVAIAINEPMEIKVSTPYLLLDTFLDRMKSTPCDELDLEQLNLSASRGFVDMLVLCQALLLSDEDFKFTFVPAYSYKRSLRIVTNGEADVVAEAVWLSDIDNKSSLASDAVLPDGEFVKGIYTVKNHPMRKLDNVEYKLNQFYAVSRENWQYDWNKLKQITPLVTNSSSYRAIFKMLEVGRADFTLMEFGTAKDLVVNVAGVELFPIKNVKVIIPGSRHFMISRQSTKSKKLLEMLNIGIAKMEAMGELKELYKKVGYYNEQVKNWRPL